MPACDFEQEPPDRSEVLAFLRSVEQQIGAKPILYVNSDFLDRSLARATDTEKEALKRFPLWFADYGVNDGSDHGIHHDTHGFKVVAHQFTSKGTVNGVESPTDLDELSAPSLDSIAFKSSSGPGHAPPWELVVGDIVKAKGRLTNPAYILKIARALKQEGRVVIREKS